MKKSTMKNGRPWTTDDEKLLDELPMEDQASVLRWIQNNLIPGDDTDFNTSYGLKHLMTRDTGIYVTNNQFKDAMQKCGYQPLSYDDLNWAYALYRRSPALILHYGPPSERKYAYRTISQKAEKDLNQFYGWMWDRYGNAASPEGDFARDMHDDLTWPRPNHHAVIRRYLEDHCASDRVLEIFEECWADYKDHAYITSTDRNATNHYEQRKDD